MAGVHRRMVELDGVRLWVTSQGTGRPVILIHGLGASSRWWGRNIPPLAAHFRVHAVDLAGFGRSRGSRFVLARAAAIVARLIEDLGEGPADVVGHSMGGYVAAELAADRPDLVRRLVLTGAAGVRFDEPFAREAIRLLRGVPRLPVAFIPTVIRDALAAGIFGLIRGGHQVVASDLGPKLGRIEAPTLVLWGARDPLIAAPTGERLARAIRRSRFVVVPDAAHNVMWDKPQTFNRLIVDFLTGAPDVQVSSTGDHADANDELLPRHQRLVSRYVIVDGVPVHVRMGYPTTPSGPVPVVLVHGFVVSSRSMVPLAKRLSRRNRVYAPDLPGFGWSGDPGTVLDVPGLADALARTLDALAIRRAILVGSSFGCQVVAHAAARHPDRTAGVVLVGPTFDPAERRLLGQVLRFVADAPRERLRWWPLQIPDYVLAGPRRVALTLRHAWRDRIERTLPRVAAPALVVRGTRDPLVPPAWARRATSLLPDGQLAELAGAAHAAAYSAAAPLADAIEPFMAAIGAGEERRASEEQRSKNLDTSQQPDGPSAPSGPVNREAPVITGASSG